MLEALVSVLFFLSGFALAAILMYGLVYSGFSNRRRSLMGLSYSGYLFRFAFRVWVVCALVIAWEVFFDQLSKADRNWEAVAAALGASVGLVFGGLSAFKNVLASPPPSNMPRRTRVDYNILYGVFVASVFSWGYAYYQSRNVSEPPPWLGNALGLFIEAILVTQVINGFGMRALSASIKYWYRLPRNTDFAVAGAPILLGAIGYVIWYPAGLLGVGVQAVLVGLQWLLTNDPPSGTLGALRSLWRRWKRPSIAAPTKRPEESVSDPQGVR